MLDIYGIRRLRFLSSELHAGGLILTLLWSTAPCIVGQRRVAAPISVVPAAVEPYSSQVEGLSPTTTAPVFAPKVDYTAGAQPFSVAVGDFNGDGKLDLVTANYVGNSVSVFPGAGFGTFGPKTDFAVDSPQSVAVGDFNNDGNLDIVTGNVSILFGTGNGSFASPVTYPAGGNSVTVGDFNGDGHLDLVVANTGTGFPYGNTVSVLLNTGSGTFGPKVDYQTATGPFSLAVGDFNSDGILDIAAADVGNTIALPSVSVLLGVGNGKFGPKADYATAKNPISVAVGDFNGDGHLDLATGNSNRTISVLLGTGNPAFGVTFGGHVDYPTSFTTSNNPRSLAVADFDRDGMQDLALANSGHFTVFVNTGGGIFGTKIDYPAGPGPLAVATGDFNGDGWPDVAVANAVSGGPNTQVNNVSVLLNATGIPFVSINNVSQNEGVSGTTSFNFTVSLNAAGTTTGTVNYATADGTATIADNDYQATSGTLSFAPGEISKTITVLVNGDTKFEPNETFQVSLSAPTNLVLGGNASGTGTIVSDETSAAHVTISGRVLTADGAGLRNARVDLTDESGVVRTVITSAFGYYSFNAVGSGRAYIVGVSARRYRFRTQLITVKDTLSDLNFVAEP
ncbi:MAG: FG-GAP-like repeat-containing protein [Pyrinomonadaceae bacterium]